MDAITDQVIATLKGKGFVYVQPNVWRYNNIVIQFRPHELSFLGCWSDGKTSDYTFFDFDGDAVKTSAQFVEIISWVSHYQSLKPESGDTGKQAA